MALRELHSRRAGRQPRSLDRSRRGLRCRDAFQRLGHHLAQQQEDHPRDYGGNASGERRSIVAAGISGLADKLLPVCAVVVLYGHQLPQCDLRRLIFWWVKKMTRPGPRHDFLCPIRFYDPKISTCTIIRTPLPSFTFLPSEMTEPSDPNSKPRMPCTPVDFGSVAAWGLLDDCISEPDLASVTVPMVPAPEPPPPTAPGE